jgi:hypothetical protein
VLSGRRVAVAARIAVARRPAAGLLTTSAAPRVVTPKSGAAEGGVGAAEMRAMNFELRDQFGKSLAYRFPRERVSVLTFGDREGSEQIEGWVKPVYERYGRRVDLHGVAVLTSIPSPFRGLARGLFRKKVMYPVLLDFKGDVSEGYAYERGRANVYVIAGDGRIALKLTGAATPDGLNRAYAEVDRLLGERRRG